jgi:hypothetical protein
MRPTGPPKRNSKQTRINGGMSIHMPNAQVQRGEHRLSLTLGSGGPLIRVHTQNGGVNVTSSAG